MNLRFWSIKIGVDSRWVAWLDVDWMWGGRSWATRGIFYDAGIPEKLDIPSAELFDNTVVSYYAIKDIMEKIAREHDNWEYSVGRVIKDAYEEYGDYMYVQFL